MAGVCAVVVTYRPAAVVWNHLAALRAQVDRLVVVDNQTTSESRSIVAPFRSDGAVEWISNPTNIGLAAALNQGMAAALAANAEWIATFDQDSLVPPGFIAGLQGAAVRFASPAKVGLVTPIYRDRNLGFDYSPARQLRSDASASPVAVATTSGNLVSAEAVRRVGMFRSDYFIDCVDFEYCLRLRRAGWLILEVPGVVLEHEQGRWSSHRLWKWRTRMNDYPAARRYYQMRNRLVMWREFAAFDPRWCASDAWGFAREGAKFLLFGQDRRAKLAAMGTGAWHAITGRMGARS